MGNSLGKQPAESGVCDHLQGSKAFCLCSPRMCCLLLIVRVPCSYLVSFLFCFVFFFVSFFSFIIAYPDLFFGRHWISFMFCLFLAGFRLSLVFGFVLFYVFLFFIVLYTLLCRWIFPFISRIALLFLFSRFFSYFTNSSSFLPASVHNHIPHIPVFSLIPHSSSLPLAYHPVPSVPSAPEDVKTLPLPPSPLGSSHPAPPRLSPASFRPPSRSSR